MMFRLFIFAITACLASSAAASEAARWSVRTPTDPITDQRRGIATVLSDREYDDRSVPMDYRRTAPASITGTNRFTLLVKCDYGSSRIYISIFMPRHVAPAESIITHRFDKSEPKTINWANNEYGIHIFDTSEVNNFVRGAMSANSIAVRFRPLDDRLPTITPTFSGIGSRRSISQVYSACGASIPF